MGKVFNYNVNHTENKQKMNLKYEWNGLKSEPYEHE